MNINFLHVQAQSCQQSTDESSPIHKMNFLQIQNIDLNEHKKKWKLLFNVAPNTKSLEEIYHELQHQKVNRHNENNEKLLLQCILIHLQSPIDLKLSEEQWALAVELMPTSRTPQDLRDMSSQFLLQSAYNNPWSVEEDEQLLTIILSYKKLKQGNKWSKIALDLNNLRQSKYIRTPKQCRERWGNKLDPTINRNQWNEPEDLYFLQLLLQYGRKWAELAVRLSAITQSKKRTEFALKHRFKKLIANSVDHEFDHPDGCKQPISSDWNNKEASKLLGKISLLEKKGIVSQEEPFYYKPIDKQIKLNSSSKLVIVKNQSRQEIDLSILFNEMNWKFLCGLI